VKLDPSAKGSPEQLIRDALLGRPEVQAVFLDPDGARLWIICNQPLSPSSLEPQLGTALATAGLSRDKIQVRCADAGEHPFQRRVKLLAVERTEEHDIRVRIRVSLEWEGRPYNGEATGDPSEQIELRTAAFAALRAVSAIVGESLDVRLLGVKRLRAFDADLVTVSLLTGAPPHRLVGAVLQGGTASSAVVAAVLHALNRILGNYLVTSI
jgi:hypothetical protein